MKIQLISVLIEWIQSNTKSIKQREIRVRVAIKMLKDIHLKMQHNTCMQMIKEKGKYKRRQTRQQVLKT